MNNLTLTTQQQNELNALTVKMNAKLMREFEVYHNHNESLRTKTKFNWKTGTGVIGATISAGVTAGTALGGIFGLPIFGIGEAITIPAGTLLGGAIGFVVGAATVLGYNYYADNNNDKLSDAKNITLFFENSNFKTMETIASHIVNQHAEELLNISNNNSLERRIGSLAKDVMRDALNLQKLSKTPPKNADEIISLLTDSVITKPTPAKTNDTAATSTYESLEKTMASPTEPQLDANGVPQNSNVIPFILNVVPGEHTETKTKFEELREQAREMSKTMDGIAINAPGTSLSR